MSDTIENAISAAFGSTASLLRSQAEDTLYSLIYFAFSNFNYFFNKVQEPLSSIFSEAKFKQYLSEIIASIRSIPEERLLSPKLDIVGPALAASKYYIENENIRKMFIRVISASMDANTTDKVHYCFVEIIKQLSPLDAAILDEFRLSTSFPIVDYCIKQKTGGSLTVNSNVFLSITSKDIAANAISITNLERLGLVKINMSEALTSKNLYDVFKSDPTYLKYKDCLTQMKTKGASICFTHDSALSYQQLIGAEDIVLTEGSTTITPLGKSFADICC